MTENQPETQPENQSISPSEDPAKEIDSLLADLWRRHLPTLRERLDLLDRTAAQAATGTLDEPVRAEGQSIAHKLSGNLGMFGHQKAGDIASQIEHILKTPTPETLPLIEGLSGKLREALAPNL
jgi:HPt (histidine-containing phosphotransfer) domain-containing protein